MKSLQLLKFDIKRDKDLAEMDRIAKMLIRRDLQLSEVREKREAELIELKESKIDLIKALKNMKSARESVEEEKNKTLAIIHHFADGILVFDKTHKLLLVNPLAKHFLKIKEKEVIGKTLKELLKTKLFSPLASVLKTEKKKVFREEVDLRRDLVVEVSVISIANKKSEEVTLIIIHDVTREKLIEKMKSEFVALTAHQLRTPLSGMKWAMKMILDEELGPINKEQKEFIQDSYESNERMISLIGHLLDVTKIEEGKFLYNLELTNMEKIIRSAINSYEKDAKDKKIKIEFNSPVQKIPNIIADAEKIKVAIENLIDNSIRYSPPQTKVIISLKSSNNAINIFVKDGGVGIVKNQQKRIFEKFFRGRNIMKIDLEGTGLGLYITKNIIEAHGGKVWFESKENQGTTFYITIPIKTSLEVFNKRPLAS